MKSHGLVVVFSVIALALLAACAPRAGTTENSPSPIATTDGSALPTLVPITVTPDTVPSASAVRSTKPLPTLTVPKATPTVPAKATPATKPGASPPPATAATHTIPPELYAMRPGETRSEYLQRVRIFVSYLNFDGETYVFGPSGVDNGGLIAVRDNAMQAINVTRVRLGDPPIEDSQEAAGAAHQALVAAIATAQQSAQFPSSAPVINGWHADFIDGGDISRWRKGQVGWSDALLRDPSFPGRRARVGALSVGLYLHRDIGLTLNRLVFLLVWRDQ